MTPMRMFLLLEAIGFGAAAAVHAGLLAGGYRHREAMIAETVIATALLMGLLAGSMAPGWGRSIGLAVQGFALLGTLVGIFTIAIGVGPQSVFDVALHAGFVALLVAGLTVVSRAGAGTAGNI